MAKADRQNLERLLRSAWEHQQSMSHKQKASNGQRSKPDRDLVFWLVAMIAALLLIFFVRNKFQIFLVCLLLAVGFSWLGIHLFGIGTKSKLASFLVIVTSAVASSLIGYAQWPETPKPLVFKAVESLGHLNGENVGGLIWKARFHDIRLTIDNNNEYPVRNLDLAVHVDPSTEALGGLGTPSDLAECKFAGTPWPDSSMPIPGKDGHDYHISARDMPGPMPNGDVWNMTCDTLPAQFQLRLVVEALHGPDGLAPAKITLSGSYDAVSRDSEKRMQIKQVLYVQH
jgi:hypothetical protein